jgi:hypothetical protein
VLLVPDEELEGDGCALANIVDTDNEIRLSAIAESNNTNIVPIFSYMGLVGNKEFKRFIAKFCTNFLLSYWLG